MTAVIVKETLRKCSSDPMKQSTSKQQQQQQPAAVSKCVNLTLDGYSYVIGKRPTADANSRLPSSRDIRVPYRWKRSHPNLIKSLPCRNYYVTRR